MYVFKRKRLEQIILIKKNLILKTSFKMYDNLIPFKQKICKKNRGEFLAT